jgi:hypothetical protein
MPTDEAQEREIMDAVAVCRKAMIDLELDQKKAVLNAHALATCLADGSAALPVGVGRE